MCSAIFRSRFQRLTRNPFHFALVGFFPTFFQTSRAEFIWTALSSAGFVAVYVLAIEMGLGDKHRSLHIAIPAGLLASIASHVAITGAWRLSAYFGGNDFIAFMLLLGAIFGPFIAWCLKGDDL